MSAVRYSFQVKRAGAGSPKRVVAGRAAPVPEKVPRIARLLALAHKFQGMLDRGDVASMADLARVGRVSRARITQIMDLRLLAPEIQEQVLFTGMDVPLKDLLPINRAVLWSSQRSKWRLARGALVRRRWCADL